jgi:hemolysin III
MHNEKISQELANTITHLIGLLIFIFLIPFLVLPAWHHAPVELFWTLPVFSFGLLMVYSASTLYHWAKQPAIKHRLRIWDHISIYFLIGGSYTPLVAKYLSSEFASLFLLCMWGLIAIGVIFKLFFTGKFDLISTLSYLALGWMALFIIRPFIAHAPNKVLWLVLAGGLSYSIGVVFYKWKRWRHHHAIWHLFVLGGSISHFFAVKVAYQ